MAKKRTRKKKTALAPCQRPNGRLKKGWRWGKGGGKRCVKAKGTAKAAPRKRKRAAKRSGASAYSTGSSYNKAAEDWIRDQKYAHIKHDYPPQMDGARRRRRVKRRRR